MQAIETFLETHRDRFVEELTSFLRLPSVSADPAFRSSVQQAAQFVADRIREAGCEARLIETGGNPIVLGKSPRVPGAPTVLVYGHYDVQPAVKEDGWETAPFEPVVKGDAIYARGATDDKGQLYTHIKSVEAWLASGNSLPVNVVYVIEGEEEVGSDHLDPFLEQHRDELACDVVVISDTSQYAPGIPAITYGLRGVVACEVTIQGPKQDLHSGLFGGAVANPVNELCRLVATLHDAAGRVAIEGFYDNILPVPDSERESMAALPFDEQAFLRELGVDQAAGEPGYSILERRWARPTCDVNGIFGGYTGAGPKTIIPARATAKITCRLVPDQDPARVSNLVKEHFETHAAPGVKVRFTPQHGAPGIVFDPDSPHMAAAKAAVATAFDTEPVLIREGGSIPVVESLKRILGVETLLLGWGQNTDNLHGPNEHFSLVDFQRGIRASAYLWAELGKASSNGKNDNHT